MRKHLDVAGYFLKINKCIYTQRKIPSAQIQKPTYLRHKTEFLCELNTLWIVESERPLVNKRVLLVPMQSTFSRTTGSSNCHS